MRQVLAVIAAVLAGMARLVTRVVWEAGRWVTKLVQQPAEQMPSPVADASVKEPPEDYSNVKRVAAALAGGLDPAPADLRHVPEMTVQWLAAMERDSLLKVALAEPAAIRAHIKRTEVIRGLVPYDRAAIADVTQAKVQPRPVDRKRTLGTRSKLSWVSVSLPDRRNRKQKGHRIIWWPFCWYGLISSAEC